MSKINLQKSANLTIFFQNYNVKVNSDFEGDDILQGKILNQQDGVLVCGDMLDSTGRGIDITSGIVGKRDKKYNIRNIVNVVNNPNNIKLILGNRDVNKTKCKVLTMMKSGNILADNFNNGNINLSTTTYNTYKGQQQISWHADTKHWKPFWNETTRTQDNENYTYWNTPENQITNNRNKEKTAYGDNIFLKRFNRIFGADTAIGTMSADNLLYTIPMELGISSIDLDYLAFVVLAVFRVMFNETTSTTSTTIQQSQSNFINLTDTIIPLNQTFLNGLLTRFYMAQNVLFVGYSIHNPRKLYIFSHGGVTNQLVTNPNLNITNLRKHIHSKNQILTNGTLTQTGGANYSREIIMGKLNQIQSIYQKILQTGLVNIPIPNDDMLLLLALTAPYRPEKGNNSFIINSPINPGIDNFTNNTNMGKTEKINNTPNIIFSKDCDVVQIFGHLPKGFATTLIMHPNPTTPAYSAYYINLDFSTSFIYETPVAGDTSGHLLFNKGKLPKLVSTIDIQNIMYQEVVPIKITQQYYYVTNDKSSIDKIKSSTKKQYLMTNNDVFTNFKNESTINSMIQMYKTDIKEGDGEFQRKIYFNGIYNNLFVFTIIDNKYNKLLYISNGSLVNTKQTVVRPSEYHGNATPYGPLVTGHKQKYLKYKAKYLQLKKLLEQQNL